MERGVVLVTRPEAEAQETAERLRAMGFEPLLSPMLRIATRSIRLPAGRRPCAILVTSGNALPALPAALHDTQLLAVGDATAAKARTLGFRDVRSADGDAGALLRLVTQCHHASAGPLLLAAGERQGLALVADLQEQGFHVIRRVAYTARAVSQLDALVLAAIRAASAHAALFFSTATATAFREAVRRAGVDGQLADIVAVAISARAAAALAPLPWRAVRVASHPSQDELLACL